MKKIFNVILLALFGTSFAQAQEEELLYEDSKDPAPQDVVVRTSSEKVQKDTFEFTYKGQTLKYEVANGNEAKVSKQQSAKISGDVKIPERVKFAGKKYTVTSIGREAFMKCTDLTSVTLPNSVTEIGMCAFAYCENFKSINVAKDNSHYCSENGVLFDITKKRLIQCPSGIKGNYVIPNGVTTIDEAAFHSCTGLTSVTILNSVTTIGRSAFAGCAGLTSITIPNSVTTIGEAAFLGCTGLTTVTIPNSVTTIGESAFGICKGLTSVTIPNSVTTIGEGAFSGCYRLTILTIESATPPDVGDFAFEGISENITIYVPAESVEKYKAAEGWSRYADKIKAIER